MALIKAMTHDDLTGPEFTDRYTEALHAVIEAKQEERQLPEVPELAGVARQRGQEHAAVQSLDGALEVGGIRGQVLHRHVQEIERDSHRP
ncbi:hypothetical protein [Streptomyces sp. NPDC056817]|uniref:hypothetical protein n=1 Tax=Streptomyces sp. NPDC056817 TaxID=3345950 RepID=UPI00368AB6E9